MAESHLTRWLKRVTVIGDHWIWTGSYNATGPVFMVNTGGKLRKRSARRLMWIYLNGPLKRSELVTYSCKVSTCVNPAHMGIYHNREISR